MNNSEIVIFETKDKMITIPVAVDQETVWLNRNQMAELFDRDVKTIGKHINDALKEEFYNLDVIISVGYRVKSKRGIEIWGLMFYQLLLLVYAGIAAICSAPIFG